MNTKSELRQHLRQARLKMPVDECHTKSAAIVASLKSLVYWRQLTSVHCFEPIAALNEVDIRSLIAFWQAHHPQLAIYTSRKLHGRWQEVALQGEPIAKNPRYDCVIVPMLGFDPKSLHRLGHGGGHYDRLLSTHPQALKIGVCFELGKLPDLPDEPHDIALDVIVTERLMHRYG